MGHAVFPEFLCVSWCAETARSIPLVEKGINRLDPIVPSFKNPTRTSSHGTDKNTQSNQTHYNTLPLSPLSLPDHLFISVL
mmetsp:Transcript_21817/g.62086  ORF Transcript_21817/g.62086 Transcript_21817/m.62086 type:complete len:81 (+) Transcript_21817:795-1037(+)